MSALMLSLWLTLTAPAEHVAAAVAASTADVSSVVLLAIAIHESGCDTRQVNYLATDGTRRRGLLSQRTAEWRGPYACGALGRRVYTWRACSLLAADLGRQYREASADLTYWLSRCRRDGTPGVTCAVAHYAGGNDPKSKARAFGRWIARQAGV